jgi:hypothetical protein
MPQTLSELRKIIWQYKEVLVSAVGSALTTNAILGNMEPWQTVIL